MDPTSTERHLGVTVRALMHATGEHQEHVAAALGVHQMQVSRRMAGVTAWAVRDVHHLAAHYDMDVPTLLSGTDRAVAALPDRRRAAVLGGRQTTVEVPRD